MKQMITIINNNVNFTDMKRLVIAFFLTLLATSSLMAEDKRYFEEVSDLPGVESVYIGPAAFRMASQFPYFNPARLGIFANAVMDMKSVEIIECENKSSIDKIRDLAKKVIKNLNLDCIIDTKEDDETTRIFAVVPEDSDGNTTIGSMMIESYDKSSGDDYSLIFLKGKIKLSSLSR